MTLFVQFTRTKWLLVEWNIWWWQTFECFLFKQSKEKVI